MVKIYVNFSSVFKFRGPLPHTRYFWSVFGLEMTFLAGVGFGKALRSALWHRNVDFNVVSQPNRTTNTAFGGSTSMRRDFFFRG